MQKNGTGFFQRENIIKEECDEIIVLLGDKK